MIMVAHFYISTSCNPCTIWYTLTKPIDLHAHEHVLLNCVYDKEKDPARIRSIAQALLTLSLGWILMLFFFQLCK